MAGYIGPAPVPQATQNREAFTATSNQTSFATLGYTPGFIDVYLNGVKLAAADYTATNGSDVVLASGAASGDILEVVAFSAFTVADQAFTGTTTAANLTVTGAFTSQGIDDNANAVAITIDSSENVGIGTSSPSSKLHVSSPSNGAAAIVEAQGAYNARVRILSGNANSSFLEFADPDDSDVGEIVYEHSNNSMRFNTNASERMRITSSGSVGIGTSSPAVRLSGTVLTIDDTSTAGLELANSGAQAGEMFSDATNTYISERRAGNLIFRTSGSTEAMRIDSSGNVGIGNASPSSYNTGSRTLVIGDGGTEGISIHAGTGMLHFTNGADTTERVSIKSTVASNTLEFTTGGSEAMRIDSSGNVGIGTSTSPSSNDVKLVINSSAGGFAQFNINGGAGSAIGSPVASTQAFYTTTGNIGSDVYTERMRIDSSGNLLVGTTDKNIRDSSSAEGMVYRNGDSLDINRSAAPPLIVNRVGNSDGDLVLWRKDGATVGSIASVGGSDIKVVLSSDGDQYITGNATSNYMTFSAANQERMRLDASGNLLVGTTTMNGEGITLNASNYLYAKRSGAAAGLFDRNTNDGDIVEFRKSGATVGSIGTTSSDLYIGTGDTTIRFADGVNGVIPTGTNGAQRDGAVNLGAASNRFQHLYLSGGVYLGGTGSANKLDDYEEGTFTPTLVGTGTAGVRGSGSIQRGKYTKVGNIVHFQLYIDAVSWSTAPTGHLRIRNLPFSSSSATASETTGSVMHNQYNFSYTTLVYFMASNVNELRLYSLGDNVGWIQASIGNEAMHFYITGSYITDA